MVDNVVTLNLMTKLDIDPERVLKAALDANLEGVVVLGYDKDEGFYFASSKADGGDVLWLLETAKYSLMKVVHG